MTRKIVWNVVAYLATFAGYGLFIESFIQHLDNPDRGALQTVGFIALSPPVVLLVILLSIKLIPGIMDGLSQLRQLSRKEYLPG